MVSQPPSVSLAIPRTADARPPAASGEVKALKVSASSRPTLVAGAIAGMVRERGRAEVQAIGAAAINQAVKAVAIARGYMAPAGVDLVCVPGFIDVVVDAEARTAIRLVVEPR
jgi:stage V sporulation protein S